MQSETGIAATGSAPTAKVAPPAEVGRPSATAGHLPALDGLRGVAVLTVMLAHARIMHGRGAAGVDVFFVLSGFLITRILAGELETSGRLSFRNFYIRRWLRLAPALFLLIILYLPLAIHLGSQWIPAIEDALISLFYMSNWTRAFWDRPHILLGHTWSLAVEEQFYILWPLITVGLYKIFGRTWKAAVVCFTAAIAVVFFREWLSQYMGVADAAAQLRVQNRVHNGFDTRADGLLMGSALAFFMPPISRRWATIIGWAGVMMLAISMSGFNALHQLREWWIGLYDGSPQSMPDAAKWLAGWMLRDHFVLTNICAAAILVSVGKVPRGVLSRCLSIAPLAWVGRISYGLYLFHFPIMVWLVYRNAEPWMLGVVGVPGGFLVATASYYLLERPCLRLKERFRSSATPGDARLADPAADPGTEKSGELTVKTQR